jgi:pilus assembly protein Flp/PilA
MSRLVVKWAKSFNKNEKGATMVEYALVIVVVALVALVGLKTVGTSLNTQFNSIGNTISNP